MNVSDVLDSGDVDPQDGDSSADAASLPDFFGEESAEEDPFAAAGEADSAEDGEAAADEPAESEGAGASEAPKTVPYKRLQKVITERNAERVRVSELEDAITQAKAELVEHKAFRDALTDRYARFKNPAVQLARDADFMSALEEMAKTDRDVHGFYRKVTEYMETGQKPEPKAEEAKPDPRLVKMFEREAERTVVDTLRPLGLQDKYQKLIRSYVLSKTDAADVTDTVVKKLTKEFMTEHGFRLADMKLAQPDPAPVQKKPPTASGRGGSAGAPAAKPEKKADAAKFKTREDYLEHRRSVLDSLISDLSG